MPERINVYNSIGKIRNANIISASPKSPLTTCPQSSLPKYTVPKGISHGLDTSGDPGGLPPTINRV